MINNKGVVLLETVISVALISIVVINIFVIVNFIINENNIVYEEQSIKRTTNLVYSRIGQDLYKYNISNYEFYEDENTKTWDFHYHTNSEDEIITKTLEINNDGIIYDGQPINNSKYIKFNDISIETNDKILKLIIDYNDNKKISAFSLNYRGD